MKKTAIALVFISLLSACDEWLSEPERSVDDVAPEEIIDVQRVGGNLPLLANGTSTDTIVAVLPLDAKTRVVKFTTTAGTFALTGGQKTVDIRAARSSDGTRLRATVVLIADTIATTAVVRGAVSEFSDFVLVPFVK